MAATPSQNLADGTLRFEEALQQLGIAVEQLDDDALPLSEALDAYEEGVQLARACREHLERATLRVEELDALLDADDA